MINARNIVTLSANTSWYLYNFRASTIQAFIEQGFQVICLSPKDEYSRKLQALGCEWRDIRVDNKGTNPLKDFLLFLNFFLFYKKVRPLITFHFTIKNNIYGTFAAFLLNVPVINNITGLGTAFINKNITSMFVSILYKLSQPLAQKVCCQNQEDFDLLVKQQLVPVHSLELLPGSGVNLKRFHPSLRNSFRGQKRVFRFLFAGRMLADKGLHELIGAMKIINNNDRRCDLWMCGFTDSKNISAIPSEILEEWKILKWIKWIGATDSIEKIMAEVDCVVLPSYREGMPRCILEANAMALPVVATDVPGCRNIVSHGHNGLLCSPQSIPSLKEAMTVMLQMSEARRELMGDEGHKIVTQNYDEQLVVQSAINEVKKIIS